MTFNTQVSSPSSLAATAADAVLVVLVGTTVPADLEAALSTLVNDAVQKEDLSLKAGSTLYVHRPAGFKAPRLALAVAADASPKAFKKAAAAGMALLKGAGVKQVAVARVGAEALTAAHAEALVTAVADAVYLYRHTKPSAAPASSLAKLTVICAKADTAAVKAGVARGEAIAAGATLAREVANLPGNHFTPTHLAEAAEALAKEFDFKIEVLGRKEVEKLGMGSFLAVAKGSDEPLKFVVMRYNGAAKSQAPYVLVGKGITFDAGGISLKPAADMDEMKYDMGGAASVLGTMRALGQIKPKLNVVAIIPSCENLPDGRAVKPGDVVTSMSGKTIEILNTDAEGRLILCDALTYAERFKPAAVIDVATLTGACVIALGHHRSGLYSSDDELASQLLAAGEAAQDVAWRMPLDEEYEEGLKSNFADMGNVGGRAGGSITAALFLKRFAGAYPWAHLDIAGTAWKSGAAKGGTGRPVGLLTHYLLAQAR